MAIIADRCYARKRGGASACADIEQSRVRNAIVPVSRYHCAASLYKISAVWLTRRPNHARHSVRASAYNSRGAQTQRAEGDAGYRISCLAFGFTSATRANVLPWPELAAAKFDAAKPTFKAARKQSGLDQCARGDR